MCASELLIATFFGGIGVGVVFLFLATLFSDRLQRLQNDGKTFAESRSEAARANFRELLAIVKIAVDEAKAEESKGNSGEMRV